MIKALVFDLGNVLIPFDYSGLLNELDNRKSGLGVKFSELYKTNYNIHRDFEKGLLSEDEFLEIMMKWTEGVFNKDEFRYYYSNIFSENRELTGLLPALKNNFTLVLLSNTNIIHQKYGWGKFKFLQHFDRLILSHEVGTVKPEPLIYKAVTDHTNLPPEAHLFIDDIKEYVEAAKKAGWNALQFLNNEQLKNSLLRLGII